MISPDTMADVFYDDYYIYEMTRIIEEAENIVSLIESQDRDNHLYSESENVIDPKLKHKILQHDYG